MPANIDKCHRLANKSNVIIEFKECELCDEMLRNRKQLNDKSEGLAKLKCTETMILESLTPVYSTLDFLCRKLKRDGHLSQTCFYNGEHISHLRPLQHFWYRHCRCMFCRGLVATLMLTLVICNIGLVTKIFIFTNIVFLWVLDSP